MCSLVGDGNLDESVTVQVFSAIAGRTPLPWESGAPGNVEERLKPLRGLKRTILKCLSRDPAQRPSAAALIASWDHTFDDMQTKGGTTDDAPSASSGGSTAAAAAAAGGGELYRGALAQMSHWRPHTAVGSGSPAEDLSRIGSALQSVASSLQPTSQNRSGDSPAHAGARLAPGGAHAPVPLHPGAGSGAPSLSSRAGSRTGTPMHGMASTICSERGSMGARSTVPALPIFNPARGPDDVSTGRITTTGQNSEDVTTERSL